MNISCQQETGTAYQEIKTLAGFLWLTGDYYHQSLLTKNETDVYNCDKRHVILSFMLHLNP